MRTVVLTELRYHGRRAAAAGAAVAIGVAFLVAVLGGMQTMNGYILSAVASRATLADVVVTPGDPAAGFTPGQVARIAAVPGVAAAEPVQDAWTEVSWPDGRDMSAVASVPREPGLRWMTAPTGRLPAAPGEVAVDTSTADALGIRPGDALTLTTRDAAGRTGSARATVVGLAELGASPVFGGSRTVLATAADVQRWTGDATAGEVDVVGTARDGDAALRDAVAAAAGPGAEVRTGSEHAAAVARQFTGGTSLLTALLAGFAAVALGVAAIVIANTFSIVLAQRTRQLALLRCVGATRRQVFRAVLAESAAVGAVSAAAGVALGAAFVVGGAALAGALSGTAVSPVLPLWALLPPFAVGLAVALAAALVPAARATRIAPLAALRPVSPDRGRRTSRLRVAFALLTGVLGTGLLVLGTVGGGLVTGLPGGALAVGALLLAGPVLFPRAVQLLGLAARPLGPVGRIAVTNAVRNPSRAAATGTALTVGVLLVTLVSVGAASSRATIDRELGSRFPIDAALTGTQDRPLAEGTEAALAGVDGVTAHAGLRGTAATVEGAPVDVAAAGPEVAAVSRAGTPAPPEGTVLVPRAAGFDQYDGDTVTVAGPDGTLRLTARKAPVPSALVSPADLARLDGSPELLAVWLRAADGTDPQQFRTDVRRAAGNATGTCEATICEGSAAELTGAMAQRAEIATVLDVMLRIVTGLLAVALLIAIIGIGNAMSLSVLERGRESGLQRALGMTRRQLRASLGVEALLLAGAASVIGVLSGIALGFAGSAALLAGTVDTGVALAVPWAWILAVVAGSVAAGLLASVLPARRAARVPPTVALAAD